MFNRVSNRRSLLSRLSLVTDQIRMDQTYLLDSKFHALSGYGEDNTEQLTLDFQEPLTGRARVSIHDESNGSILLPEEVSDDMKTCTFRGKFEYCKQEYPDRIGTTLSGYNVQVDFYGWLPVVTLIEKVEQNRIFRLRLKHKAILNLRNKLVKPKSHFYGLIEQVDTVRFFYDYYSNPKFPRINYSKIETVFIEIDNDINDFIGETVIEELKKLPKVNALCFNKHYDCIHRFISSRTFVRELLDMDISLSFGTLYSIGSFDKVTIKPVNGMKVLLIKYSNNISEALALSKQFCELHNVEIHQTYCELESCYDKQVPNCVKFVQENGFDKLIIKKWAGNCSVHINYNSLAKSARSLGNNSKQ